MNDLYKDNVDVEYSVVQLMDIPTLALQATGPLLSARFASHEFKKIQVKWLTEDFESMINKTQPKDATVIVYEDDMSNPLLACDLDELINPILAASRENQPWLLLLQYLVEGDRYCKIWTIQKGEESKLMRGPDGSEAMPRWIVGFVDGA